MQRDSELFPNTRYERHNMHRQLLMGCCGDLRTCFHRYTEHNWTHLHNIAVYRQWPYLRLYDRPGWHRRQGPPGDQYTVIVPAYRWTSLFHIMINIYGKDGPEVGKASKGTQRPCTYYNQASYDRFIIVQDRAEYEAEQMEQRSLAVPLSQRPLQQVTVDIGHAADEPFAGALQRWLKQRDERLAEASRRGKAKDPAKATGGIMTDSDSSSDGHPGDVAAAQDESTSYVGYMHPNDYDSYMEYASGRGPP